MRKYSVLLGTLLIVSMLLAACGGEETSTTVPSTNIPPVTAESTMTKDAGTTTGTPEGTAGAGTTTPGVPVTGENNPSRVSNLMDFIVLDQNGEQVGEVDDMVLDMDNSSVSYIAVGTGGFLDLGEKTLLVPWNMLTLQADATGGQQNAFILNADQDMLTNAPDVDLDTMLPGRGQPAQDWDTDIRNFWESGGASGGTSTGTGTQAATESSSGTTGTAMPATTATTTTGSGAGTGTGAATATTSGGTVHGQNEKLQGVMLASDILGATITIGQGQGQGTGSGTGTGSATAIATSTTNAPASPAASPEATSSTSTGSGTGVGNQGSTEATIEDVIVDPDSGDVLFLVLSSLFNGEDRWIPVPLSTLRWDATNESFLFVANANALQNAPFFQPDQFPDTSTDGWDSEFNDFWQNNGGTGTGPGASATATP